MVFHAYAKNANDDWSFRYLLIGPSKEVVHDWFNVVQDRVGDHVLWKLSDDFFVFDRNKLDLGRSTAQGHEAPKFMDKLIIQLLSDLEGNRVISTFANAGSTPQ
ncbi:hypothetical protein GRF29_8g3170442 [Pseudopithomyces chartarum]|uniref:Uncharacterized protein n=1 Tax=Pseudopithomyces chartarum TaxID=1892770 RepID=A0AAN6M8V4_9PLEO|nr:hypothetical protein GRF29_8g3170442 [Pseudopithomyces chartarum]